MLELTEEQALFHAMAGRLYGGLDAQDPLSRLRAKGWDHFEELGLPHKKAEQFQYIRLNRLLTRDFVAAMSVALELSDILPHVLPECKDSYIVFINGALDLTLSNVSGLPEKMVAIPLKDALKTFGSFINNQISRNLLEETDPFAALNAAYIQKALFLYLPPSTVLNAPLQMIHLIKGDGQMISPRMECFFGALSEAAIITSVVTDPDSGNFLNSVMNCTLEEGAQVKIFGTQGKDESADWHFDALRAQLKKDSRLIVVNAGQGSLCYRDDYRVSLVGTNAEVALSGVHKLGGAHEGHTHVLVDHQAPECRSLQTFKKALDDASRSSFEGKIYVHKIAQKTQAFQLNNNLNLSDGASSHSKPNLEIFADDVKASHGATFGSLDKEQLFYFLSRGISEEEAKKLLIQGFCFEIIDRIQVESLCSKVKKEFL